MAAIAVAQPVSAVDTGSDELIARAVQEAEQAKSYRRHMLTMTGQDTLAQLAAVRQAELEQQSREQAAAAAAAAKATNPFEREFVSGPTAPGLTEEMRKEQRIAQVKRDAAFAREVHADEVRIVRPDLAAAEPQNDRDADLALQMQQAEIAEAQRATEEHQRRKAAKKESSECVLM